MRLVVFMVYNSASACFCSLRLAKFSVITSRHVVLGKQVYLSRYDKPALCARRQVLPPSELLQKIRWRQTNRRIASSRRASVFASVGVNKSNDSVDVDDDKIKNNIVA